MSAPVLTTKPVRSFYGKLVAGLLAGFLLMSFLLAAIILNLTSRYQDEVTQKLHYDLAKHVVGDDSLLKAGEIDQKALKAAFHSMMILGPSFEFYILSPEGKVTTYSAADNKIKRMNINLAPIKQFISGQTMLPVLGDDPRSRFREKIFSAAEIRHQDQLKGYLYVIIGGELYDGVEALLRNSHWLSLSIWSVAAAILFSLVITLWLFAKLTRPLHRLATDMARFQEQGFSHQQLPLQQWKPDSNDEIERLGYSFNALVATLSEQYDKVKTTDELRKELISYVSHDLRTPLAALIGYLETWQIKQSQLNHEEAKELIERALGNASQVNKLVEQLFELARLESDDASLQIEPLSIAELGHDVLQKLQLKADEKSIELDIEPKDPSLMVLGDLEKLERVLTNLVDNAIRHVNQQGHIHIRIEDLGDQLEINVEDNGSGIAAEDLPHLFDRHYRAKNSAKGSRQHAGLGLALVKRIIELHQSQIGVTSEIHKGTRFHFRLKKAQF